MTDDSKYQGNIPQDMMPAMIQLIMEHDYIPAHPLEDLIAARKKWMETHGDPQKALESDPNIPFYLLEPLLEIDGLASGEVADNETNGDVER